MRSTLRFSAVAAIFLLACIGWGVLGDVMSRRSGAQSAELRSKVADLWGQPQRQTGPSLVFEWAHPRRDRRTETVNGVEQR